MKKDKYLYIFLHIPRTGGSSFFKYIEGKFPKGEAISIDYKNISDLSKEEKDKIRFLSGHTTYFGIHELLPGKIPRYITILREPAEEMVSLYHSRMDEFPENKIQSFNKWYSLRKRNETTLFFDKLFRSTKKRVVLFYKIKRKVREVLDRLDESRRIHTFLKRFMKKKMSHLEGDSRLENAKKLLDNCWFIGITKNLNKDMEIFCKLIGLRTDLKDFKTLSKRSKNLFELDEKTREKIYKENLLDKELYEYAVRLNEKMKKEIK